MVFAFSTGDKKADGENRPDKIIDAHTAAFQGNNLIVFIHHAKGNQNRQQDADRRNLGDNQGQFKLQKLEHSHDRQTGIQKFIDVLEKIDNHIYSRGRDQHDCEILDNFFYEISIEDGHSRF